MAIVHVQGANSGGSYQTGTSFNLAFPSTISSGSAVVGYVSYDDTVTLSSITDDKSNTYTVVDSVDDAGNGQKTSSFVLGNITNGAKTLTFNFSSTIGFGWAVIDEYSGTLASSNPVDGTAHSGRLQAGYPSTTNGVTATAITTSVNGDLIWCGVCNTGGNPGADNWAAGTGFTLRNNQSVGSFFNSLASEDQVQSTAGSITASFTASQTGNDAVVYAIAIKPASTGVSGTLAVTETQDTSAFSGGVLVSGTLAVTETTDVTVFNGGVLVSGTLAVTENTDVTVFNGAVGTTGTLAVTEGQDTSAFSGGVLVSGSLAVTETTDISAFSGDILVSGSLSVTETQDVSVFSGTVGNVTTGTLAVTEGSDTSAFSGGVLVSGSLSVTEGSDTSSFSGGVLVSGTLSVTEGQDTSSFSGSVTTQITGTLSVTETGDTSNFLQMLGGGKYRWNDDYDKSVKRTVVQTQTRYLHEDIKKSAQVLSSLGGHARAASLTPKQRTNIATVAAKARWR